MQKAIAVLTVLLLAACAPQTDDTIAIGFLGPLSGEMGTFGEASLGGAELAVQEINARGGILGKEIRLVVEDDQCLPSAVTAMRKLTSFDGVVAISGPDCSSVGGPSLPIAQEAEVPVVIRWASAPHLAKTGDYIFRVFPSDALQGSFAAEYVYDTLGARTAAILYTNNDYGKGLHDVFTQRFEELGGEMVADEAHDQGEIDLRAQLTKIAEAEPDVIYFVSLHGSVLAGLRQAREMGIETQIMGADTYDSDEVFALDAAEGTIYTVGRVDTPLEFQQRVESSTGKRGDLLTAALGYDSIMVIADAIERAGTTDHAAVRDAIATTSKEGVSIPVIAFDEDGELTDPVFEVRTVRDGESVVI